MNEAMKLHQARQFTAKDLAAARDEISRGLRKAGLTRPRFYRLLVELASGKAKKYFTDKGEVTAERDIIDYAARANGLEMAARLQGLPGYTPTLETQTGGVSVVIVNTPLNPTEFREAALARAIPASADRPEDSKRKPTKLPGKEVGR